MKKIKSWLSDKKNKMVLAAATAAPMFMAAAGAAEGDSAVVTVLTTTATSIANDAIAGVNAVLPIIIPVMGLGIIVMFVVKFIKRIMGKA